MKKILVVAAHPDDEVLGCGGSIARHITLGDVVHVMILAEGITARDVQRDRAIRNDELDDLSKRTLHAHAILGTTQVTTYELPDNRMDSLDRLDIVKLVEQKIREFKPDTVYTHHAGDVNVDHRYVHEAVVTACRPLPGFSVRQLLFFEIASSTEWQVPGAAPLFMPTWFIQISDQLDKKMQALAAYGSEMRQFPHPRSLEGLTYLARWRGATVGVPAAEAFMIGRKIEL